MARVTINGVAVDVADGTSILAAADQAGVFVPRFCYHPDLSPAGNCRICQVEIEGSPKLVVACMTPVKDGMVVRSDSDRVRKAVRGDLELLLLNHPVDCPICDQAGECYLQDFYMQVGLHDSRIELAAKVRKRKVVELGPTIVLDSERCVMCSRCIRFSDEVSGTHQFGFFFRGARMEIGTFADRPLDDRYSGCYADVCPVGALTSNDFRFRSRVWFLDRTDSVCPECSTGCNLRIDHKNGEVFRFLPRRNPGVNRSWMCDEGRFSYRRNAGPERLLAPELGHGAGRRAVEWAELEAEVAGVLGDVVRRRGSGAVAGLAGARATLEELWLFRLLVGQTLGSPHLDFRLDPGTARTAEREDGLLRRADKNPNTRGAELLGIGPGPGGRDAAGILADAAAGRLAVLWILEGAALERHPDPELVRRALAGVEYVIVHDSHRRPLHDLARAVVAQGTLVETDGTLVNHALRIQRVQAAFPPPGRARTGVAALGGLLAALGGRKVGGTPREVFAAAAAEVPALAGLSHDRIGPLGVELPASGGTPAPGSSIGRPATAGQGDGT